MLLCEQTLSRLDLFRKVNRRENGNIASSESEPSPEVIKLFSCSTQLSMKFSPLINVKMPTIVGILTYMSGKNNILGLTEL